MRGVDAAGRAVAATRIRDCDVLVYRDLLMLEHRVRHGLSFDEIGALYRLDPSYVGKRIRSIPAAVRERMGSYVAECRRHGSASLGEDQVAALGKLLRKYRRPRSGVA